MLCHCGKALLLPCRATWGFNLVSSSPLGSIRKSNMLCTFLCKRLRISICVARLYIISQMIHIYIYKSPLISPGSEVYWVRFWMLLLGGPTSKPTVVYSNGSWITGLNVGKLTKELKDQHTTLKPTRQTLRYIFLHAF